MLKSLDPINLLRACCFLIFGGRAWTHFNLNAPYRDLFWDEGLLSGFITTFTSMSWKDYVTNPATDRFVVSFTIIVGIIFAGGALVSLLLKKESKWQGRFLLLATFFLFFLTLIFWKTKFFHIGQLIEYSIQWGCPLFLYAIIRMEKSYNDLLVWMKIAIAFTFVGHGLYAFGFHPVPGNFVDMIISITGFSEQTVLFLLKLAGIADFLIAILIFFRPKIAIPVLWYAVVWGLLTAIARIWSHYLPEFSGGTINWWLPETLLRLPHGLFPLFVILILWHQLSKPKETSGITS